MSLIVVRWTKNTCETPNTKMIYPFFSAARHSTRVASMRSMFSRNFVSKTQFANARITSRGSMIPKVNLFVGSVGTFYLVNKLQSKSTIFNDAIYAGNRGISTKTGAVPEQKVIHSRFGGKLDYQELTIGSITGLFLGILAGKLSSAIVFLTLSCYLLTQFLENRGIITIPWRHFVNVGSGRIDVKKLVLNQPSFKISFVLTFLIAAFNV